MTPKERADDIMGRCWWRPEEHPGELRPLFAGLGPEIEAAIREAVAETKEAAAKVAEAWIGDKAACPGLTLDPNFRRGRDGSAKNIAAAIRAMKEAE